MLRKTFSGGSSVCSYTASCRLSSEWWREIRQEARKKSWRAQQMAQSAFVSLVSWLDTQQEQRTEKEDPRLLLHRLGGYKTPVFFIQVPHERHQPRLLFCCCTVIKWLKGSRGFPLLWETWYVWEGACRESSGDLSAHWSCPVSGHGSDCHSDSWMVR